MQDTPLATVRAFVDREVIPHARALQHADAYPTDIVEGMKEMGLSGSQFRRSTQFWGNPG